MKTVGALTALVLTLALNAAPASARGSFVQDGAGMFAPATVSSLNQTIGDLNSRTGKEVLVVTVPGLDGRALRDASERTFAQEQVNGVLIYIAKSEKQIGLVPDRASERFFPPGTLDGVRQAIRGYFRTGDFDQGITTGVGLVLDQYRSHEGALAGRRAGTITSSPAAPLSRQSAGGLNVLWLLVILVAGFLIIRALFRAMAGPRMMPPGYGGPMPGGPAGYGPGFGGYGGGGGSFFSGLLGGLGGAFLGNELFGRHDGGGFVGGGDTGNASLGGYETADSSGWQPDAGQADVGAGSFGSFGDSGGGGFDTGGGFDSGGGGW
jgi:uncharacterized protein